MASVGGELVSMVTPASRSPHTNECISWLTTNSKSSVASNLQSSRSISADGSHPVWVILWEVLVLSEGANNSKWVVEEVVGERRCRSSCWWLGYAFPYLWNGLSLCHGFLTVPPGNLCPGYVCDRGATLLLGEEECFLIKKLDEVVTAWNVDTTYFLCDTPPLPQWNIPCFCLFKNNFTKWSSVSRNPCNVIFFVLILNILFILFYY